MSCNAAVGSLPAPKPCASATTTQHSHGHCQANTPGCVGQPWDRTPLSIRNHPEGASPGTPSVAWWRGCLPLRVQPPGPTSAAESGFPGGAATATTRLLHPQRCCCWLLCSRLSAVQAQWCLWAGSAAAVACRCSSRAIMALRAYCSRASQGKRGQGEGAKVTQGSVQARVRGANRVRARLSVDA
jgi:hypothetical protein